MEGTLEVRAIENGTVIDHIPANSLFKIIKILGLDTETHRITFGMNLESKRMGTKAIIKINERFCQQEEINRLQEYVDKNIARATSAKSAKSKSKNGP